MKTLKLTMITAVLTVGLMSLTLSSSAQADRPMKTFKTIYITIEQAMQNQGLVTEMYLQLDDDFLENDNGSYTAVVNYQNFTIHITGTYNQWVWFFRTGWMYFSSSNGSQVQEL